MWYAGCKYLDPCALVNLLGLRPPPLFHVVIGPVRQCQGLIEARDGDVICFGYRLGQLSSSAALLVATIGDTEDAEPPCGQPPEDPFGPSLPESCGYGKEDKETPCERLPGSDSFKSCYVGEGFSFPPFPFGCHYGLGASSFLDFISKDFCIYLQLQDHVSALPCREGGALHNKLLGQWNRDCKLLTEPVSYNRSDEGRLEALRFCAHAFGEDWFFIDPWDLREYHLLPLPPSVSLPLAAPTEVACALLSPEYCHEHITATVNLPAELDDLYQALQVARCPDKARRSPFFIEVNPQPESAWGALIVVPLWARFERVICLDLRSIDGRLFACNAPVTADRFAILFLTDLPLHTECDIYVGGMQFPLQDGAQVYLNQGDLVTLVPLGSEAPAYYDLEDMLQTPLTWDEGQHRLFELQEGLHTDLSLRAVATPSKQVWGRDVSRSAGYPLFLACTLLETLVEHFHEDPPQVLPNPLRKQFIAYAASADPSLPVGPVCFVDGSFCTETPGEPVAMGWSCVFVDAAEGMCGVLAAQMPQWAMDLVEVPSAFRAECCALIVGYWIGLSVWNEKGFSILSDCQSAIDIAQGLSAIRTAGIAQVLGHVAGCCQSLAGGNISLRHVAGHSGLVGNELADLCAKSAAKGRDLGTLAWDVDGGPDWWQGGGYLWSWCGVVCRWAMGDDALPPPLGSDLSTGRDLHADVHPDVLQPFLPDPARCLNADQLFSAQLCLRMASYNALSLAGESTGQKDESLAFRPARPAMLASQLEAHGVHCAAIQEARTQMGSVVAWTEPAITAANMVIDHVATLVDVHVQLRCGAGCWVLTDCFGNGLPTRKQPFAPAVLPSVLEADGSLCQTPEACAIVFADVASAYYATRRELAARHPEDELANEDSSVSPAEEDSLEGQLARPSALAQQSAEPWLRALTTVLNEDTWMRLQGDDVPVATFQGTRPGSAWADLTFGVLVARILHLKRKLKGEDGCEASGLPVAWDGCRNWSPRSPDSHTAYITDLVWADDVSSPVAVDDVHALAKAVGVEVGALADAFASHGFSLSYGPRKTAAIMCPRGAGARAVRRHLFGRDATIAVMREASGVVHLPIVETYKHLGVLQMPAGNIHAEIKQRCALAWAAFREGRTKVFRCRRVSLQRRGTLLSTLVLSKLVFGAGAWPPLGAIDTRLFGGAVTSLYRATLNVAHQADQHLSTATICALLGLPDAYTLLVVEQLRYLRQLVAHAPDPLWALLRNDAPYLDALRDALAWLYARVAATTTLPHPLEGLEQCRIQCYAAMQALHKAIRVHSDGELIEPCEAPRIYPEACLVCRKAFETRGAWACHASKLHGYRLAATVLAGSHGDTLCRGCGKCYANTGRLRRHLLHSAVCRAQWGAFTMAEGVVIPALHERQPPLHIEGVLERMHEGYDPASYSKGLLEALCRLRSPSAQQVWDLVVDFVEPLQVLRQTLDMWRRSEFFCDEWCEIAEDVLLMLDPEVCCDVFSKTPKQSGPTLCCPDLPGPFGTILPFVLTGAMAAFALQTAPCPSFSYPWIGGATLAAAKRQAAFVEASCDVI
ncbi:unnamed protein product, partial [Symbiodinium sp. KB8]